MRQLQRIRRKLRICGNRLSLNWLRLPYCGQRDTPVFYNSMKSGKNHRSKPEKRFFSFRLDRGDRRIMESAHRSGIPTREPLPRWEPSFALSGVMEEGFGGQAGAPTPTGRGPRPPRELLLFANKRDSPAGAGSHIHGGSRESSLIRAVFVAPILPLIPTGHDSCWKTHESVA